jgi:hypothetical protein
MISYHPFGNRVLKRIFRPKREEDGSWRKFQIIYIYIYDRDKVIKD